MLSDLFLTITHGSPALLGLAGGLVIALLNMIGALLVFIWRKPSDKVLDIGLGIAAGIMLTASYTSLILPGIAYGGIGAVIIGIVIGALVLIAADKWVPHLHIIKGREGQGAKSSSLKAVWLFIIAITIHNMPEGLAVGVGFGSGDLGNAIPLMLAIGIQNIPEGFAVAVSAIKAGMGNYTYASIAGIRAGLVEIPLAVFGALAVQFARPILPYAMGFAAGAMLYVISNEIIPETHRKGHHQLATIGSLAGVVVMLYLDMALV